MKTKELETLISFSRKYYENGWMLATAGNLSIFDSENQTITITASGKDKGNLREEDFITVSLSDLKPTKETNNRPSAETSIHQAIYKTQKNARAVLHVHTPSSCILEYKLSSNEEKKYITLPNTEILKAFGDFREEPNFKMLVVHNYTNVPKIASILEEELLKENLELPFFLIENHGLTVWGNSVYEANKFLEATEFVMNVMVQRYKI
ncbi:MAG: methylthioribulose 1-phosphate dehydratase [Leptospiraceae bacterium]|nr:methylthioribulose 1-phosphate dehydratase [Leptospiraceae bacterium]